MGPTETPFWMQVATVFASLLMFLSVLVSIGFIAYQRALYGDPPSAPLAPSPIPTDHRIWWSA